MREKIFEEINQERARQDNQWGGVKHDATHLPSEWISYIVKQLGKIMVVNLTSDLYRKQLIRVAALAIAAIEAHDSLREQGNEE